MRARRSVVRGWLQAAALAVAAALVVPAGVSGQSLGDAAAREKERRKGKAKTYSEDDLRRAGGTASGFETAAPDEPTAEGATPAEGTTAEGATPEPGPRARAPMDPPRRRRPVRRRGRARTERRAAQEKEWRERLKKSEDDVNAAIADIEKLQKNLSDLTGNYYSASRTNMMNRMDELKKKLATAQETLENVREEGRRNRFRSSSRRSGPGAPRRRSPRRSEPGSGSRRRSGRPPPAAPPASWSVPLRGGPRSAAGRARAVLRPSRPPGSGVPAPAPAGGRPAAGAVSSRTPTPGSTLGGPVPRPIPARHGDRRCRPS